MKKTRCIDCMNCVGLYVDLEGYLGNECREIKDSTYFSLEKWFCEKFDPIDKKAKVCSIKGSDV